MKSISYGENLDHLKKAATVLMIFGLLVTMTVGLVEAIVKGIVTPDELKMT